MAALLATWAATSEGVSIALEALAVLRMIGDGRVPVDVLMLPMIDDSALRGEVHAASEQLSLGDGVDANDLFRMGSILTILGGVELAQGNLARAQSAVDAAQSIFSRVGDRRCEGMSHWYRAVIATAGHEPRTAAAAYRESLLAFLDVGATTAVHKPLLGLAAVAAELGQAEIAAHLLGIVDEQRRRLGNRLLPFDLLAERQAEALSRQSLGDVAFVASRALGQSASAPEWIQMADDIIAVADARGPRSAIVRGGRSDILTTREQEVLRLVVDGRSNPEIADALCVGVGTAKTHVAHILAKFGVSTRAAAASYAIRQGLV
ncbi:MAG: LuxR C-terminal-related transcriptional regulator [Thermomicrobiales bacterium]